MRMSVPTCPKETARVSLGLLLKWLLDRSKINNVAELARKSEVERKDLRRILFARGECPEKTIRALLPHLSAIERFKKMDELEGYLKVIYCSDQEQDSPEPSSLELAIAS